MAFRLKLQEPMEQGVRRIATEQIDRAASQIEAAIGETAATAVHETRKCIKRARALLRFARPMLDPADFKRVNGELRDVAKALSATRDSDVLAQTLADIAATQALKPAAIKRLGTSIAKAREQSHPEELDELRRRALTERLHALRARLVELPVSDPGDGLSTGGIAACLADCRRAFSHAFDARHDDAFHDWRKSVQLHWRQMQLVERAWPAYCHARVEEARALSMLIGTDRDLALLRTFAAGQPLPKAMQREIEKLVALRQKQLRSEAKARGERLLAEGTEGFCRRLEEYWAAAVQLRIAAKDRSHQLPGKAAIGA